MVCEKSLQVRTNDKIDTESEAKSEPAIKKDISSPVKKTSIREEGVKKNIFAPVKKTTIKEEGTDPVEKKPFEKDVPTKAVKKPSAGKILCMY